MSVLEERPVRDDSHKIELNEKENAEEQAKYLDPEYLKDKSVKKVSIATLKRRIQQQKASEPDPDTATMRQKSPKTVKSDKRSFMDKLNPSFIQSAKQVAANTMMTVSNKNNDKSEEEEESDQDDFAV
jgi:hypothetical protein